MLDHQFWSGKKVFVTGHTGFKGSWLSLWLLKLGAQVSGYALAPDTEHSLFRAISLSSELDHHIGDIRDGESLTRAMVNFQPEIVFHMAAQPLVLESFRNPVETWSTNVLGTIQVLEACRKAESVRSIVVITTDKVYENLGWAWPYRETDILGGHDPYSSSKAATELASSSWYRSFLKERRIGLATVRAGNVIGGGDFCKYRIIPDAARSVFTAKNFELNLRHPNSTRPWQFVLEPLLGYLLTAERLGQDPSAYSSAYNFSPHIQESTSVGKLIQFVQEMVPRLKVNIESAPKEKEAVVLQLDSSKARSLLGWKSKYDVRRSVHVSWEGYEAFFATKSPAGLRNSLENQIQDYSRADS